MSRALTISNLYTKKFKTLETTGRYRDVLGTPESAGLWLVFGREKNGKTALALQLSDYLSTFDKALYVSAEEGLGYDFIRSCQRAGLETNNRRIHFLEYTPYDELVTKLAKRKSPGLIFIDNCTVYKDEITFQRLRDLVAMFPTKLFVFLAHEERNEPYTALAKLISKLAKVIFRVEGMRADVYGRVPGGLIDIDKNKSQLYHGTN